jgi:glycosyltransferase involved in cell wall biosynthesis
MTNPLISIIIPTKNEKKNIGRLIESIQSSSSFDTNLIEIIVVDNPGTTDKTLEIAQKLNVRTYQIGPERSAQRNHGAEKAAGTFLYFVDADMEFVGELLTEILSQIQTNNENVGYVVPERIPGDSLYCKAVNIEKQMYDGNDKISGCRIFSREAFLKIGGYNTELIMGEDWDLDKRLRESGVKIIHLKHHILHHEEELGFFGSIKKKLYYARNLKNYTVGLQDQVSPLYRYAILFSKPRLFIQNPLAYIYLISLKSVQFASGVVVLIFNKF